MNAMQPTAPNAQPAAPDPPPIRILVDGDACPVKPLLERAAERHGVQVIMVAAIPFKVCASPLVSLVQIPGGPDAVDEWIIEACLPGDIVVTQDIPLAAAAIARGARAIEVRGEELGPQNIGGRLATRNLMMGLRDQGLMGGGPRPYTRTDRQRFAQTLGRMLDQARAAGRLG